jgi:transcriptional regulator with XRE-family HTH domain
MPITKQDINLIIASKLDILRRYQRLKQYQMAEILGVNRRTYSLLETGKISFTEKNITDICQYFKIKEEDFIKERKKLKTQNQKVLEKLPYLEDLILALLGELRSVREERNIYMSSIGHLVSKITTIK